MFALVDLLVCTPGRAMDLQTRNPAAYHQHTPSFAVQWPNCEQPIERLQSASLVAWHSPSFAVQRPKVGQAAVEPLQYASLTARHLPSFAVHAPNSEQPVERLQCASLVARQ